MSLSIILIRGKIKDFKTFTKIIWHMTRKQIIRG